MSLKIKVYKGRAVHVEPGISYEDIKKAELVVPNALKAVDENENTLFAVATTDASPSFNNLGCLVSKTTEIMSLESKKCTKEEIEYKYAAGIVFMDIISVQLRDALEKVAEAVTDVVTEV